MPTWVPSLETVRVPGPEVVGTVEVVPVVPAVIVSLAEANPVAEATSVPDVSTRLVAVPVRTVRDGERPAPLSVTLKPGTFRPVALRAVTVTVRLEPEPATSIESRAPLAVVSVVSEAGRVTVKVMLRGL